MDAPAVDLLRIPAKRLDALTVHLQASRQEADEVIANRLMAF